MTTNNVIRTSKLMMAYTSAQVDGAVEEMVKTIRAEPKGNFFLFDDKGWYSLALPSNTEEGSLANWVVAQKRGIPRAVWVRDQGFILGSLLVTKDDDNKTAQVEFAKANDCPEELAQSNAKALKLFWNSLITRYSENN